MDKRKITLLYFIIFLAFGPCLIAQDSDPSQKEYCAFCDPIVIEKQKFFEDDLVIALYTHKPIFPGHCLVIPKRHVKRFEELSHAEASHIMQVMKKVNHAVQNTFGTSSYLLLQKNGRESGQTVPHVHFHYIPRKTGDTSSLKFVFNMYLANLKKPINSQEMEKIVGKLRRAMLITNF